VHFGDEMMIIASQLLVLCSLQIIIRLATCEPQASPKIDYAQSLYTLISNNSQVSKNTGPWRDYNDTVAVMMTINLYSVNALVGLNKVFLFQRIITIIIFFK
jgi:hypothetical protein